MRIHSTGKRPGRGTTLPGAAAARPADEDGPDIAQPRLFPSVILVGSGAPSKHRFALVQRATTAQATFELSLQRIALYTPSTLRLSLALLFVWFGILKVTGDSPVTALVSATLPWGDPDVVVRLLGVVEICLGLGLLIGRAQRILLLAVAMHLTGTLLTFVMAPGLTMRHGDPFLLTADGEFVVKNLVLISAAVLLASQRPARVPVTPSVCGDANCIGHTH